MSGVAPVAQVPNVVHVSFMNSARTRSMHTLTSQSRATCVVAGTLSIILAVQASAALAATINEPSFEAVETQILKVVLQQKSDSLSRGRFCVSTQISEQPRPPKYLIAITKRMITELHKTEKPHQAFLSELEEQSRTYIPQLSRILRLEDFEPRLENARLVSPEACSDTHTIGFNRPLIGNHNAIIFASDTSILQVIDPCRIHGAKEVEVAQNADCLI
jgi:hypothetical protein